MNHDERYSRQSIRLSGYDYSLPGAYFITVVAEKRKCLFGEIIQRVGMEAVSTPQIKLSKFGELVLFTWNDLANHVTGIELDQFIVIPNHVHGIIQIVEGVGVGSVPALHPKQTSLSEIIRQFKTHSARRINEMRATPGATVWRAERIELRCF